ncbi:hypothetical protein AHAS_Ahas03G0200000 [Arachis hypogaea]
MKIVRKDLVRNGPGSVKMVAVDSDDLWYAYNLIAPGDSVMAVTVRKVLREAASGGREAERIKLKLEIKVEEVADYDKEGSMLRIRGKNILENEHVKIGAFHTLELELQRPFVLRKEVWDSYALEVLQQASDPSASADLAVVLMQEGLAHILLIGRSMTITRSRIETSIPRKHGPAIAGYESALNKFFENVLQMQRISFIVTYFWRQKEDSCALLLKTSRALFLCTQPRDTSDPARACYGAKHVEVANERLAVQTLLITDDLFRNSDIATSQKFVELVNSVKDSGGSVHVFSSLHVSGEQLAQISGIAAILRFPLPDLEDIEM